MTDIHIERRHTLGLARARRVAQQWVAKAEQSFGLRCDYEAGDEGDRVQFSGAGLDGSVEVTAHTLAFHAQLGFPVSGFADMIEDKLTRNIDALLAEG